MILLEAILNQRDLFKTTRLPSLYSDFAPLKTTNRDGYDANCQAWATALGRALLRPEVRSVHASSGGSRERVSGEGEGGGKEDRDVVGLLKDRCCIVADKDMANALAHSQWGRPLALGSVEVCPPRRNSPSGEACD